MLKRYALSKKIMLKSGEIHVWHAHLKNSPAEQLTRVKHILSPEEWQRGERFITEELRQRFWLSHAILRVILASYLSVQPAQLSFYLGAHGKPYLENPKQSIQFNMSHSHDRALYAINLDAEIGIDIEYRNAVKVEELAERFFAASEFEAIMMFPENERLAAFYRVWTRKEAFVKAIGSGLSCSLQNFAVSSQEQKKGLFENCLRSVDADLGMADDWLIYSLVCEAGFEAALSVAKKSGQMPKIIVKDFIVDKRLQTWQN